MVGCGFLNFFFYFFIVASDLAMEEIKEEPCKEKEREMCSGERTYKFFWV